MNADSPVDQMVHRVVTALTAREAPDPEDLAALRRSAAKVRASDRRDLEEEFKEWLSGAGFEENEAGFEFIRFGEPRIKLSWNWNHPTIVTSCYVVLSHDDFPRSPDERSVAYRYSDFVTAQGGKIILPGDGLYAGVWPVVDLGWRCISGEPLHIGPIRAERR